jgi:hypothetical protein
MSRGIVMVENAIKAFAHDKNHTAEIPKRELHLIRGQKNDIIAYISPRRRQRGGRGEGVDRHALMNCRHAP